MSYILKGILFVHSVLAKLPFIDLCGDVCPLHVTQRYSSGAAGSRSVQGNNFSSLVLVV